MLAPFHLASRRPSAARTSAPLSSSAGKTAARPSADNISAMSDPQTLLYEESDGVAWVTLNRPAAYNAFDSVMQSELRDLWSMLRKNDDVRCVVLTGSGDKAFCTGLDRGEIQDLDELPEGKLPGYNTPWDFDDPGKSVCPKSNDLWKPVIAAVNGMACGGAFYILGEVDFIIAADHATFFDPHVTYGMPAAFEPIFLLHKMPFQEVVRLSLLGAHERMSAQRAHQVGLVSEVVPLDELHSRTAWAAQAIADQPALAVGGTVRALWTGLELTRRQALDHAFLFTNIGTNAASLAEGQQRFSSGDRIDWRLR
jgi:enoyl-CoA hydratase/carnithine racemase